MFTTLYTLADGSMRTTCGQHRILGYAAAGCNSLVCRGCGESDYLHEATAETVARKAVA